MTDLLAQVRKRIAGGKERHSDQRTAAAALARWYDFEQLAVDALAPLVEALVKIGEHSCEEADMCTHQFEIAEDALADLQEQLQEADHPSCL